MKDWKKQKDWEKKGRVCHEQKDCIKNEQKIRSRAKGFGNEQTRAKGLKKKRNAREKDWVTSKTI